jgi:hypothetical protein
MISLRSLFSYLPDSHGEHGVDATLHMLCSSGGPLHEVFSNPPGGSWTQFDLIRPETENIYRWDHIPRAPTHMVKRPDLVLQLNRSTHMNLLSVESKLAASAAESDMAARLTRYFLGARGFTGLKERPAWHRLRGGTAEPEVVEGIMPTPHRWHVIPPDAPEEERFWFRDYPSDHVSFWSGFAYALNPETYSSVDAVRRDLVVWQIEQMLQTRPGLDVIIAVGWAGEYHKPFIVRRYSERFSETEMARGLDDHLRKSLVE